MRQDDPIARLIAVLCKLPGIGEKSATRLAYFILRSRGSYAFDMAQAIREMKEQIVFCSVCRNLTPEDPCRICEDPQRDKATVMLVEEPHDLWAVEKTGAYCGQYHVLHGTLSPLHNQGPSDIELNSLLERVRGGGISEVIIATNPNVEGEATAAFIAEALAELPVKVTRIARGIPVGGDLEYVDKDSLNLAIKGRRPVREA